MTEFLTKHTNDVTTLAFVLSLIHIEMCIRDRCYAALHGWPVENRVQEAEAYYDRFGGS